VSKISLAPDASGSGIFTIASPNSNTNRTLTLPDDTGTIVTNSGNQAGSFTTLAASSTATFAAGAVGTPAITTTGDTNTGIFFPAADTIAFAEGGAEAMRINSAGHLLIATTTDNGFLSVNPNLGATEGTALAYFYGGGSGDLLFQSINSGGGSATNAGIKMGKNGTTGRSINGSGTINASGTDYAEYMTKCSNFTVAKGDVVGIDVNGKLTNVFANAISFVVKSTDPSYVGGDTWGSPEALGLAELRPLDQSASDEVKAQYAQDKAVMDTALETARQLVDRIAFCGQVPVNVMGATAGQYIVPIESNGGITGVAVNEADMTLAQYMKAVGKVIAIEENGRARIIVKVA
jgi:hypothetical protein